MTFALLDFYTWQLLFPSIVGVITFINGFTTEATGINLFFAAFVVVWATMQTELWKRQNAWLNLWWGTINLESTETDQRPTFVGVLRYNPVTDSKEMHHQSKGAFYRKIARSLLVIGLLVLTFVFATACCFYLKYWLTTENFKYGGPLSGIANAGVISTGNEAGQYEKMFFIALLMGYYFSVGTRQSIGTRRESSDAARL